MKTIYRCMDGGQDGSDNSVIGHVADADLAARVVQGRGTMGVGDGSIEEVQVWESEEDFPSELKTHFARRRAVELRKLLDELPEQTKSAIIGILTASPLDDFEDDIPF